MPYRKTPLATGEYYHIYNRGVNKLPVFDIQRDYQRFCKCVNYYKIEGPKPRFSLFNSGTNFELDHEKKIVEVICFCLMPNHFHLIVKQLKDGGITEFLRKLLDSYTKYFNIKHGRVGPLFQGEFKSVLIESNEQLLHLTRYFHINPVVAGLVKDPSDYFWSSYNQYLGLPGPNLSCAKEVVLDQFKNPEQYQEFVLDQVSYGMELEIIKHQLVDGGE